jgi:neutral ceramidase
MKPSGESGPLLAGAAQVEITPPAGTHVAGAVCSFRPAEAVLDPLYAKAVVLESEGQRIALVSLDITIITEEWSARLREGARKLGLDPTAVMVHAIQTHTAPGVGHFMLDPDFPALPAELEWVHGGQEAYAEFAIERATQALEQALDALEPVQVAAGSALRDGLAFNRRAVMRDGSVSMLGSYSSIQYPLGPPGVRYAEGPTDPEVGVVCLRNSKLQMVAMLLHFSCHPVSLFPWPVISADWPGTWAQGVQERFGPQCVGLVLNGSCGNLNPWQWLQPDVRSDHRVMGRALAETTEKTVTTLNFSDGAQLDHRLTHLPIPLREMPPETRESVQKTMEEHPQPVWSSQEPLVADWEWFHAASLWSVELARKRSPELLYEIQAFRVGDTALVGLPGEPFSEGQLALKIASPTYPTYVAHCTSQYVGYIPTREAISRGGHEGTLSYWSKLAPEALDMIVERSTELLKEMFPGVRG